MAKSAATVALSYSRFVFKFGRVTTGTKSVIWDGGAAGAEYPGYLTAEAACELVSSSGNDAVGGGGAVKIQVWGQGDDGLEITERVVPTGAIPVALVNDYAIIYRAAVIDSEDAGALAGPNHGTITVRRVAGPISMAIIQPTFGQTYMCVYRVPLNMYGELTNIDFFCNSGKDALIEMKRRKNRTDERGWRGIVSFDLFEGTGSHDFGNAPLFLYPGEDIIAIGTSTAAGTDISGHFSIKLYPLTDGLSI